MLDPEISDVKITRNTSMGSFLLDLNNNKKILGEVELSFLMQKLKNSYNSLQKSIIENKNSIDKLKFEEKKYANVIFDNTIECKEVNYIDDITLFTISSSEQLKAKVENLQSKKKDYLNKVSHELDYAEILKNKLKNERQNLLYYTEFEIEVKDKLNKISFFSKNLNINQNQTIRKSRNLNTISSDLNEKIQKTNSLIFMQTSKCEDLFNVLKFQKSELDTEKDKIRNKNNFLEKNIVSKKKELKELISTVDKVKTNKVTRENIVIKLILGLNLLKK